MTHTAPPTPTTPSSPGRLPLLGPVALLLIPVVIILSWTGTQLHSGPGWGPLGVPALIDTATRHAALTVVILVLTLIAWGSLTVTDQQGESRS